MYSLQNFYNRFDQNHFDASADHFVAVAYNMGAWTYFNNDDPLPFTPMETDVLVASVDYTADTVQSLEGVDEDFLGIHKGYTEGNLTSVEGKNIGASEPPSGGRVFCFFCFYFIGECCVFLCVCLFLCF